MRTLNILFVTFVVFSFAGSVRADDAVSFCKDGQDLISQGKYDDAIAKFKQAIQKDSRCAEAYFQLGSIYASKNMEKEMEEQFQAALNVKPDYLDVYFNWGIICNNKGRYEKSIPLFKKALTMKLESSDEAKVRSGLGWAYKGKGQIDEAIAEYRRLVELKPKEEFSIKTLAGLYAAKNKHREAVEQFTKLIAINAPAPKQPEKPGNAIYYFQRAGSYAKLKMPKEAISDLTRAVQLNGQYRDMLPKEPAFQPLKDDPGFQKLLPAKTSNTDKEKTKK